MTGPTPGLSGKTQVLGCGILPTYCLSSLALQLLLLRLRLWLETGTEVGGGGRLGTENPSQPLQTPGLCFSKSKPRKSLHSGIGCEEPGKGLEGLR